MIKSDRNLYQTLQEQLFVAGGVPPKIFNNIMGFEKISSIKFVDSGPQVICPCRMFHYSKKGSKIQLFNSSQSHFARVRRVHTWNSLRDFRDPGGINGETRMLKKTLFMELQLAKGTSIRNYALWRVRKDIEFDVPLEEALVEMSEVEKDPVTSL